MDGIARSSIDNNRNPYDIGARCPQHVDCGQHAATRCRRILHREHPPPGYLRAFDSPLQSVCLFRLSHHTCVYRASLSGGRVKHRCCYWVSTERKAADRVEIQIRYEIEHHPSNERGGRVVQGHSTKIYVPVRLATGRQHHLAVHHG